MPRGLIAIAFGVCVFMVATIAYGAGCATATLPGPQKKPCAPKKTASAVSDYRRVQNRLANFCKKAGEFSKARDVGFNANDYNAGWALVGNTDARPTNT